MLVILGALVDVMPRVIAGECARLAITAFTERMDKDGRHRLVMDTSYNRDATRPDLPANVDDWFCPVGNSHIDTPNRKGPLHSYKCNGPNERAG